MRIKASLSEFLYLISLSRFVPPGTRFTLATLGGGPHCLGRRLWLAVNTAGLYQHLQTFGTISTSQRFRVDARLHRDTTSIHVITSIYSSATNPLGKRTEHNLRL